MERTKKNIDITVNPLRFRATLIPEQLLHVYFIYYIIKIRAYQVVYEVMSCTRSLQLKNRYLRKSELKSTRWDVG